jgi:hypothetical protein
MAFYFIIEVQVVNVKYLEYSSRRWRNISASRSAVHNLLEH